jgi:hypothetical protein
MHGIKYQATKQKQIGQVSLQREVLVLRDDLKNLFISLSSLYQEKFDLLNQILKTEDNIKFYLHSDTNKDFFELFEKIDEKIECIDILSFHIGSKIDTICEKSGIDREYYDNYIDKIDIDIILIIKELVDKISETGKILLSSRSELIELVEKKFDFIKNTTAQVDEYNNIITKYGLKINKIDPYK